MNVTNHCYRRYAERWLGIKDNREVDSYISEHKEEIANDLLSHLDNSTFVYYGVIADNTEEANYYINIDKSMLIVCNKQNDAIVTTYKIDYGFCDDSLNKTIIEELISNIKKLENDLHQIKNINAETKTLKQTEQNNIQCEIEELNNELNYLNSKLHFINEELKMLSKTEENINKKIKLYATKLCYSITYKKDFERELR